MTWWMWIVLWTLLVLAACAVLGMLGWKMVKSGLALMDQLERTGDTMSEISRQVDELGDTRPSEPAIFADPGMLRAEREHRAREKARTPRAKSMAPSGMTTPVSSRTIGTDV